MKRLTKAQQNKIRERYFSGLPVTQAEIRSLDLAGPPAYKRYPKGGHGSKANPSKAQKREKVRKASVQRRVASALAKFLHQANPAMKTAGASIQRLKGGVIKITPIKANPTKSQIKVPHAFQGDGQYCTKCGRPYDGADRPGIHRPPYGRGDWA